MSEIWAEAGDTFFTRSRGWLGRIIRHAETEIDPDDKAWANHTGVVVESGWVGGEAQPQAIVVEALWHVRRGALRLNGTEVRIFRPIPAYDEAELGRFIAAAEKRVGQDYGWWKLLLIYGKRLTGYPFEKLFFVKNKPICSISAGEVNEEARRRSETWPGFGRPPMEGTPDSMMDFARENPGFWWEVGE